MENNKYKLCCQTITWGESQSDNFPKVFSEISTAGFSGAEIGFRHIKDIAPIELKKMLADARLTLAASHIGGNLEDVAQASEECTVLDQTLDYLQQMETKYLMYSGLKYENDAQFERDLAMVINAAKHCQQRGVTLLYHNHDWEFENDRRIINALIDKTNIGFCPDVGWIMRGGEDVIEFFNRINGRIGSIHFKDFATDGTSPDAGVDAVMLGEGVAPLAPAAKWAANNVEQVWMTAEQDKSSVTPAEAAQNNAIYLRNILAK